MVKNRRQGGFSLAIWDEALPRQHKFIKLTNGE
jgi:hypothetical protein